MADQKIYGDALKASGDEALAKEFAEAYAVVPQFAGKAKQDELLRIYGLSKQALQNPPFDPQNKPSFSYFSTAGAKWGAWEKVVNEGITPVEAQKKYIELVNELKEKYA